jgi:small-conductance mechanosensitive channel
MDFFNDIWANELYRKLILTGVIIVVVTIARNVIQRVILNRYRGDTHQVYMLRKIADYVVTAVGLIALFGLWIQRSTDLTVALGLVAAGLAFALQEIIGSIAGWLSIIFGRPFSLGDRIETGGIHGDVVDISVLRTSLMETGNWLGGMQSTGRIVTLSNAFIFKEPLFNYSRDLMVVWDEVRASIPYSADWQRAKALMVGVIDGNAEYQALIPLAREQQEAIRRRIVAADSPLEPRAYTKMADSWIELGVVYPVAYNRRRGFRSIITEDILRAFAAEGIPLAFPTMTVDGIAPLPRDDDTAAPRD